ncbi:methyl-accepting chemotaxis protein [Anaeromicropila herbilytica]|uniref:Chemotaxis protein n=1 Tax=Anaeromicropila herbilytica TaxID=2785025 RepID=A0A7R7EP19_9FIRM|nr:methyl-accepting chemotaxis protein [Anaeromicropila herbilytica]BCN32470.1 chemotaxis protein [Anaeromicropila herbilytica]
MKKNSVMITSIRFKVVILLLACIVLAIGGSYLSILPGSKSSIIESTENNLMDLSQTSTQLINKSIESVNETMTSLSHSNELYTYMILGGSPYKAQDALDTYLKDNTSFTSITIYDSQGKAILSSDDSKVGTDGLTLPYVKSVIDNGVEAQSDIIVDGVKTPSIICSIPLLTSAEETMGVISVTVPANYITNVLSSTKLRNINSSYAYLVSNNGKIIYHPQDKLIGQNTKNKLIQRVIEYLNVGKLAKTKALAYTNGQKTQYISFSVSKLNHWILVIVADEDELLAPMNKMITHSCILLLIQLCVMAIAGYIIASTITKPIKTMTKTIKRIAELDFSTDKESDSLCKRKDETGEMSRVIQNMRNNIRDIIENINSCADNSNENADSLNDICNNVNNHSTDIASTVEDVLASMEETASSTEIIYDNIMNIQDTTKGINTRSVDSMTISNEIVNRASTMEINTKKAVERIQSIFYNVKNETTTALEQSHAVSKISVLTESILDIANEIKLLSLNASIEAARAGEFGRGFAVVASEIGTLSVKSTNTVTEIAAVVNEVTDAVKHIDKSLNEIISLMEKTVLPDYEGYIAISTQYSSDADVFHNTMDNIHSEIEKLSKTTELIVTSISEINTVVMQSTKDVSNISKQSTDIVGLTDQTFNRAKDSKVYAENLKEIVLQFNLNNHSIEDGKKEEVVNSKEKMDIKKLAFWKKN